MWSLFLIQKLEYITFYENTILKKDELDFLNKQLQESKIWEIFKD